MEIKAEKTDDGWALIREDTKSRVLIDKTSTWPTKALLETALKGRNLQIGPDFLVVARAKPGRPRKFSPEDYAERRRAQNRQASKARRARVPDKVSESGKAWREKNPEKVLAYRAVSYTKHKNRLQTEPEYREKFNAYQKQWKASKKEPKE